MNIYFYFRPTLYDLVQLIELRGKLGSIIMNFICISRTRCSCEWWIYDLDHFRLVFGLLNRSKKNPILELSQLI